ncbi:MAG: LysM peptidoglycan-binding domain-containing protein [Actinomycetota bacterium]
MSHPNRLDRSPLDSFPRSRFGGRIAVLVAGIALAVGIASSPLAAHAAGPTKGRACVKAYIVRPGDAWSVIATRTKVTMRALLAANGATTRTVLYPGGSICLPASATVPIAPATTPASTVPVATPSTPAAAVVAPARTYSSAEVVAIVRAIWPDDQEDHALQVVWRESNNQPTARNSCCYGLFQINFNAHRSWLATNAGITNAQQLLDPHVNALVALVLYNGSGWGPWGG